MNFRENSPSLGDTSEQLQSPKEHKAESRDIPRSDIYAENSWIGEALQAELQALYQELRERTVDSSGRQFVDVQSAERDAPPLKLLFSRDQIIMEPEKALSDSVGVAQDALRKVIATQLKLRVLAAISQKYPELIHASERWQYNRKLLWSMFKLDDDQQLARSENFEMKSARRAFKENQEIADRFGIASGDSYQEHVRRFLDAFGAVGGENLLL